MLKRDWVVGLGIGLIAFIGYLATLCPTVYVGDSGELTAAAYTLGVAHPPGYPLLCLVGKIFTWIPLGDIAYRINLMSAFFAAATICFLFLLLVKLTETRIVAAAGSLGFAFSLTFWSQANIGKSSYAINIFFVVLILYTLSLWTDAKTKNIPNPNRFLYLSALFFGLGLSNHHTILMLFPLYLIFIIYIQTTLKIKKDTRKNKKSNKPTLSESGLKIYFYLGLCLILGLLLYLYLPIRAHANPPINWGIPDSWGRFLAHFSRKQYGSMTFNFSMPRTPDIIVNQMLIYGKLLIAQFTPILLVFAPIGIIAWYQRENSKNRQFRPFFWLTSGIFILYSLGLIYLINYRPTSEEITLAHVFFIPSYLMVAIWITLGINYLVQLVTSKKPSWMKIGIWFILIIPIFPLLVNYKLNNRQGNKFGFYYARNILAALPQNAIFFSIRDSNNFTLAYQKYVEKQRPDITIYDMSGGLFEDTSGGYRKEKWRLSEAEMAEHRTQFFIQLLAQNKNLRPIFFEIPVEVTAFPGYVLKHDSYFYRIASASDSTPIPFNPAQFQDIDRYYHAWEQNNLITRISNFYVREALIDYHFQLGRYFLEINQIQPAMEHLSRAETIGADFSQVHNNLGIIYYMLGKFDLALKKYEQALAIEPTNREALYNIALYYNNIAKNPDLAKFYYQQFESQQKK